MFLVIQVGRTIYPPFPVFEASEINITQEGGKTNILAVNPQGCFVRHANCDSQACVAQGEIHLPKDNFDIFFRDTIVCLPHQVMIRAIVAQEAQRLWADIFAPNGIFSPGDPQLN